MAQTIAVAQAVETDSASQLTPRASVRVVGTRVASTSSAFLLTCTLSSAVRVDERIVVVTHQRAGSQPTSVTDSAGHTYTRRVEQMSGAQFVWTTVWDTVCTVAMPAGATVVLHTAQSVNRCGPMAVYAILEPDLVASVLTATGSGTTTLAWSTGSIARSGEQVSVLIGGCGWGSANMTSTVEAGYSEDADSFATDTGGTAVHKSVGGGGSGSDDVTGTLSGSYLGWGAALAQYYVRAVPLIHCATETDTAGVITRRPLRGPAVETEIALPLAVSGTFRAQILADAPTAWWMLDELAGTTAADRIGTNEGTYVGSPGLGHPSIPSNDVGTATRFDGIDDYVSLPGPVMPATGSAELWFEWSGGIALWRDATTGVGSGWIFGFDNSGTFAVRLANTLRNTTLATTAVRDGRRHHLVVTWAPAAIPRIYLDGVDVTSTVTTQSPSGGTLPWYLGQNGPGGSLIRGRIQHAAFYATALSSVRAAAHYAAGLPATPATPVTYDQAVTNKRPLGVWKLDETVGTVAADSAGVAAGGSPGTYVGSPTLGLPALVQPALGADAGTSVGFDGVDDAITMDGVPSVVGSWEMWFRWTAGTALARDSGDTIFGWGTGSNFYARMNSDDAVTTKPLEQVRDGSTHHLVITWNGVAHHVYLDGVDITGTSSIGSPDGPLMAVIQNYGFSQFSTGRVDRIASYPYALTAADVLENFQLGRFQAVETDTAGTISVYRHGITQVSEVNTARQIRRLGLTEPRFKPFSGLGLGSGKSSDGAFSGALAYPWSHGDLHVMQVWTDDGTVAITTAGGGAWTALTGSPFAGPGSEKLYVWYRIADSADTTPTLTRSGSSGAGSSCIAGGWVVRAGSFDPSNPIHAIGTVATGTGTSYSNTGVTTTVADAAVMHLVGVGEADNSGVGTITSWLFGSDAAVEHMDVATIQGNDSNVGVGGRIQHDPGASGTATASGPSAPWVSLSVAITPAPSVLRTRIVGRAPASSSSVTTHTLTIEDTVTTGETLVIADSGRFSFVSSCVDSQGNTYTERVDAQNSMGVAVISSTLDHDLVAGDTITITRSAGGISGGAVAVAVDARIGPGALANSGNNTASASWATGSVSTVAGMNWLVLVAAAQPGSCVSTAPSGYERIYFDSASNVQFEAFAKVAAGGASESASGTWSGANPVQTGVSVIVAIPFAQVLLVRRVEELDIAGSITRLTAQTVEVGQASETDTANVVTTGVFVDVNGATETDTAQRLAVPTAGASETDTALPLAKRILVAQATETDSAQPVLYVELVAQASETDTAGALTRIVNRAVESDSATRLARLVNRVTETDTARVVLYTELVGQALETDTAVAIAVRWFPLIDPGVETDTALRLVQIVNPALETDTATVVTLDLHQLLEPDTIIVEGATVFEPAIATGELLSPDFWIEPDVTVVYDPTLIVGTLLEPDFWTEPEPTVYDPTLIPGQFLEPDFWTEPEPTVYEPELVHSPSIHPDFWTEPEPTVYDPELSPGQILYPTRFDSTPVVYSPRMIQATGFLYPERIESTLVVYGPTLQHGQPLRPTAIAGSITVYSPALIRGQLLHPNTFTGLSVTVYSPTLQHAQPLHPGPLASALTPVVFEPHLIPGQPLHPDFFDEQLDPVVYEPALQHRPDPIAEYDSTRTLSALRTAR